MLQFEEMAGILGEFSGQMEQAADVTEALVPAVRAAFRKRRIALEDMLVLKYGDGAGRHSSRHGQETDGV